MPGIARNFLYFASFAILAAVLAKFLFNLDFNKRTYNQVPGECGIIPDMPGIIGLATSNGGRLYFTVPSVDGIMDKTHLFTFYSDNRTARDIEIRGGPKKFLPKAGQLTLTNGRRNPKAFVHRINSSSVDIFETDEQSDAWKYLGALSHDTYEGLASLSASGPNSFYFVKTSILGSASNFLERVFAIPTGQLYFANGDQVHPVMRMSSPTAVYFDDLRKTLFVTSFARNSISRIKTTDGYKVSTIKEYDLGCSPTSIWKDFDGTFLITCHPIKFRYLLNAMQMTSSTPSMVLHVSIPVDENKPLSIKQLYSNDGATISGLTTAVRAGGNLLFSNGEEILNCEY